jgi:hypothetical protein
VLLLQGVNGKAVFFVNSIITATGWTLSGAGLAAVATAESTGPAKGGRGPACSVGG